MPNKRQCPKCGSTNIDNIQAQRKGYYETKCFDCGYILDLKKNNSSLTIAENDIPSGKIILEG